MGRTKIDLPEHFPFSTIIPVRITDINYGNHVGNDAVLSIIHEARMQFLAAHGFTEMNIGGAGMIMSDVAIEFRKEVFYGDSLIAEVVAGQFTKIGFDLYYRLSKQKEGITIVVAIARTGMVCFDYDKKKISPLPEAFVAKMHNNPD